MGCGESLGEQESPEHFRKTVTMLFSDVVSSTALGEQLDPETLSEIMGAYFESMKVVVERHEGTVAKFMGDAVMAVFGIPELHEDDALRAVRAAADMRDALVDLNARLAERWGVSISTRTGINTGVVAGTGVVPDQNFVAGDTGNVAARLEKLAGSNEILLGAATYRLVSGAVEAELLPPVELKGKEAPATVYRLVRVKTPLEHVSGQQRTRMVGRKDDLDVLQWALQRAVEERACRLVTILGAAGVGKSRLVDEFLADVDEECTVLRGRCLPYGDGDHVLAAGRDRETGSEHLRQRLAAGGAGEAGGTARAVERRGRARGSTRTAGRACARRGSSGRTLLRRLPAAQDRRTGAVRGRRRR